MKKRDGLARSQAERGRKTKLEPHCEVRVRTEHTKICDMCVQLMNCSNLVRQTLRICKMEIIMHLTLKGCVWLVCALMPHASPWYASDTLWSQHNWHRQSLGASRSPFRAGCSLCPWHRVGTELMSLDYESSELWKGLGPVKSLGNDGKMPV